MPVNIYIYIYIYIIYIIYIYNIYIIYIYIYIPVPFYFLFFSWYSFVSSFDKNNSYVLWDGSLWCLEDSDFYRTLEVSIKVT